MSIIIAPSNMKKFSMPPAKYKCKISGRVYTRDAYSFECPGHFATNPEGKIITNVNQEDAYRMAMEKGGRMSTCAEELKLSTEDPPTISNPLFGNSQHGGTITCDRLLKPEGQKTDYTEKRPDGSQYWLRIFCSGFEETNGVLVPKKVADIWVPESGLVREVYPFGIPSKTVSVSEHVNEPETHWFFDPSEEEIGLTRDTNVHTFNDSVDRLCFLFEALIGPSFSDEYAGFRVIQGPEPQYSFG